MHDQRFRAAVRDPGSIMLFLQRARLVHNSPRYSEDLRISICSGTPQSTPEASTRPGNKSHEGHEGHEGQRSPTQETMPLTDWMSPRLPGQLLVVSKPFYWAQTAHEGGCMFMSLGPRFARNRRVVTAHKGLPGTATNMSGPYWRIPPAKRWGFQQREVD